MGGGRSLCTQEETVRAHRKLICWIRGHRWRYAGTSLEHEPLYRCRRCGKRRVGRSVVPWS